LFHHIWTNEKIMTTMTFPAVSKVTDENSILVHPDGAADFVISPQFSCHYDPHQAVLWSTWAPRGIPSFNIDLLYSLERGSQMIEEFFTGAPPVHPLRYIVLRSKSPRAFNVGGDLGYFHKLITSQNRSRLTEYARAAINVQYRNYIAHNLSGVTTVALLEGDALGGGLESALSCDMIIAEKHVKAGFPEVLFSMFPGMGGISFLARRVTRTVANEMTRSGRQYSALELLDMGVIDKVVETGEGMHAIQKLIRQREHQEAAHAAISAVDHLVRPLNLQELNDVVKIWVDCALKLSKRSLEWMQRLHQRQIAVFGPPLQIAHEQTEFEPHNVFAVAA
jgi:DSF synthase